MLTSPDPMTTARLSCEGCMVSCPALTAPRPIRSHPTGAPATPAYIRRELVRTSPGAAGPTVCCRRDTMASYTPGPRDDPRRVAQRLVAVWAAHAGGIRREGHDAARVAAGPAAVAGFEVPHDLAAHLVVGLTGRLVTPGLAVLIRRAGRIGLRPAATAAGRDEAGRT